jgi:hypothetical protein
MVSLGKWTLFLSLILASVKAQTDPDEGLLQKCSSGICRSTGDITPLQVKEALDCPNCTHVYDICTRDRCPQEGPISVQTFSANKEVIFMDECLGWELAQAFCCEKFGGKLWEPRTKEEYDEVRSKVIDINTNFRYGEKQDGPGVIYPLFSTTILLRGVYM